MHSLQGWPKQFDFAHAKLRVVYVGYLSRGQCLGSVGVCPYKDFTEVLLKGFKALLLIPGSLPLNPSSCHLPVLKEVLPRKEQ